MISDSGTDELLSAAFGFCHSTISISKTETDPGEETFVGK